MIIIKAILPKEFGFLNKFTKFLKIRYHSSQISSVFSFSQVLSSPVSKVDNFSYTIEW